MLDAEKIEIKFDRPRFVIPKRARKGHAEFVIYLGRSIKTLNRINVNTHVD